MYKFKFNISQYKYHTQNNNSRHVNDFLSFVKSITLKNKSFNARILI